MGFKEMSVTYAGPKQNNASGPQMITRLECIYQDHYPDATVSVGF